MCDLPSRQPSSAELRHAVAAECLRQWEELEWVPRIEPHAAGSPTAAAMARSQMRGADWHEVFRSGTRAAVIRAWNGHAAEELNALRAGVRDAVVEAFNRQATAGSSHPAWEELLSQGVEDAVIEAFNAVRAPPPNEPSLPAGWRRVDHGWILAEQRLIPLAFGEYHLEPCGDNHWNIHDRRGLVFTAVRYFPFREEVEQHAGAKRPAP